MSRATIEDRGGSCSHEYCYAGLNWWPLYILAWGAFGYMELVGGSSFQSREQFGCSWIATLFFGYGAENHEEGGSYYFQHLLCFQCAHEVVCWATVIPSTIDLVRAVVAVISSMTSSSTATAVGTLEERVSSFTAPTILMPQAPAMLIPLPSPSPHTSSRAFKWC